MDGELNGYRERGRLDELPDREVCARTKIGIVFQRFNLFPHLTVLENLIAGPVRVKGDPAASRWRGARLLAQVGLGDKGGGYPISCPAASSSGWPSPGRWPWNPS